MDRFAGDLVNGVSASVRADSLQVVGAALNDLRESRAVDAEARLKRFARLQAKVISECARDSECSKLTGKPLPSIAELSVFEGSESTK